MSEAAPVQGSAPSLRVTFEPAGAWCHRLSMAKPVVPTRVRFEALRSVLAAEPLALSSGAAVLVESVIFRAWPRLTSGTYMDAVASLDQIAAADPEWGRRTSAGRARRLVCQLACVERAWVPVDAEPRGPPAVLPRSHVRECSLLHELDREMLAGSAPEPAPAPRGPGVTARSADAADAAELLQVTRADTYPGFRASHDPSAGDLEWPAPPDPAEFAGRALGGADPCPRCGNAVNNRATANQERAGDENFETDYVCARCGHEWRIHS